MLKYDDYLTLLKERFASKEFTSKEVEESKIHKILDAVRLTPSSYNLQPWKIVIIKDKQTKQTLYEHSYNQKQIITCSHLLVFCANLNIEEILSNYRKIYSSSYSKDKLNERIEFLRKKLISKSKEELLHYASLQVYLALMNAMIASKSLMLDSCPMGGFSKEGYSKALNLKEDIKPVVLLPVGYAKDKSKGKFRFPLEDITIYYSP